MSENFLIEKFRGQPCQQVLALRFGRPEDIPAMDDLQQRVRTGMPQPEWYVSSSREELAGQLKEGFFLCLWAGPRLAAYLSLVYAGQGLQNYSRDMGLPEGALPYWANLDSVLVAPEYRGNSLQRRLLRRAERCRRPQIVGFGCTVSPQNLYSRRALEAEGYTAVCQKEKYGGHIRLVMQKRLFPLPGVYRHFKGGRYRVLGPARDSEGGGELVLYKALDGAGGLWVRPANRWGEWVERPDYAGPRFRFETV